MSAPARTHFTELGLMLGWSGREVWMLWGFFDESEYKPDGKLVQLTLGGAIASFEAWEAFSIYWAAFLNRWGIEWFHMSDFEAYEKEFKKWDKNKPEDHEQHKAMLNQALSVIGDHILHCLGHTIFIEEADRPERAKAHYQRSYEANVIDMIWHAGQHAGALGEPIALVFAKNPQFSLAKIQQHFGDFQDCNPRLKTVTLDRPQECCPLQAADIIAYETRCSHRDLITKEERYVLQELFRRGVSLTMEWRSEPGTRSRKFFLDHPADWD